MARKLSEEARGRREAVRQRVVRLLNLLYGGRQRRMAEAVRMPHPQISRVVNGRIGASPQLLDALASLPGVNPAWVREGTGEPLLNPSAGALPIAVGVLPGWPERWCQLLTGERHPVAEAFCRPSRYWVVLPPTCPLLKKTALAQLSGDHLLFDADEAAWLGQLHALLGRIVGVQLQRGLGPSYEMGQLSRDAEGYAVDLGEEVARMVEPTPEPPQARPIGEPVRRKVQAIRRPKIQKPPGDAEPQGTPALQIGPENIVALCVYLARP